MSTSSHISRGRLYRSRDGIFGGVCAGIAEYFDWSDWGVRLVAIVLQCTVAHWLIVLYIALWCMLRESPARYEYTDRY